jgi:hypothetical protein
MNMGYLKEKYLESANMREVDFLLQKYQQKIKENIMISTPELNMEQLKMLDDVIDCQIEDNKIKRSEKN